jgi:hypothetical protein
MQARSSLDLLQIFIVLIVTYLVAQLVMIYSLLCKERLTTKAPNYPLKSRFVVELSFWIMVVLTLSIVFQMAYSKSYSKYLFESIVILSYIVSGALLTFLSHRLFRSLRSNHSLILILYIIAFSSFVLGEIFTVIKVNFEISNDPLNITPVRNPWDTYSTSDRIFGNLNLIMSYLSTISMWIATVTLLHNYIKKIGRTKFWVLVLLPLLYIFIPLEVVILEQIFNSTSQGAIFSSLQLRLYFIAIRQSGGIFFAIAFWILARSINNETIKYFMNIAGLGLMLLFSCNQSSLLRIVPYPPFGIGSITMLVISSGMVLIGIYYSSITVSKDVALRRLIKKSVSSQSNLLGNLGADEAEKGLTNLASKVIIETGQQLPDDVPSSLEQNEVKDYVKEAIDEIRKRKSSVT